MLNRTLPIVVAVLVSSSAWGQVEFHGLGDLRGGGTLSLASEVSGDGNFVVGLSPSGLGNEAFLWSFQTGMIGLGDLPGGSFLSTALGVSSDGSVVVGLGTSIESSPNREPFRWSEDAGMQGLGNLRGSSVVNGEARGVSGDGSVVVGFSTSSLGSDAFRWTEEDGMLSLNSLDSPLVAYLAEGISSDGRVIVGRAASAIGAEAFRWTENEGVMGLGDLPFGDYNSIALDVSQDGSVVVGQAHSSFGAEPFVWTEQGGMIGLGHLPQGFNSVAIAISADGSVVLGHSCIGSGFCFEYEPFLWDAAHGMRSLTEDLTNLYGFDLKGWSLRQARGISDDGLTIVGNGFGPQGQQGWLLRLPDCDGNGIADHLDILDGRLSDANLDHVPDQCQFVSCQAASLNHEPTLGPADLGALLGAWGPADYNPSDLNDDGLVGAVDLAVLLGTWNAMEDCPGARGNNIPDECEVDCNGNGQADSCDIAMGQSEDCSGNGTPDECEPDCNETGQADSCDIEFGLSEDCTSNGVPDECEVDCNSNGQADSCEIAENPDVDCNNNGIVDECPADPGPKFNIQPEDVIGEPGGIAIFAVSVVGNLPTFQWRKDGKALVDSEHIIGSTSFAVLILNTGSADVGEYDCVVSDSVGQCAVSEPATLALQ